MIEQLADTAIVNLLRASVPGLNVTAGLADNDPELQTPCAVVYSVIEESVGRNPVAKLKTTIEYYSVSGQDAAFDVAATMTLIDAALSTAPTAEIIEALPPTGLRFLGWAPLPKTNQEVGDRRKTIRELTVFAS
jgi:hypothetical protein